MRAYGCGHPAELSISAVKHAVFASCGHHPDLRAGRDSVSQDSAAQTSSMTRGIRSRYDSRGKRSLRNRRKAGPASNRTRPKSCFGPLKRESNINKEMVGIRLEFENMRKVVIHDSRTNPKSIRNMELHHDIVLFSSASTM
jgi:hypothetical protein